MDIKAPHAKPSVATLSLVLIACTPSSSDGPPSADAELPTPTPAVEPEPEPELAKSRDLGPLLGGPVVERLPQPGRYASSVRFTQDKLITMEHTVSEAVVGVAIVELGVDHTVRACFDWRERSSSSANMPSSRSSGSMRHSKAGVGTASPASIPKQRSAWGLGRWGASAGTSQL